jgi:hypothetical protein
MSGLMLDYALLTIVNTKVNKDDTGI